MSANITVNDYRTPMGQTETEEIAIRDFITNELTGTRAHQRFRRVDVYNLNSGHMRAVNDTPESRLIIFHYGSGLERPDRQSANEVVIEGYKYSTQTGWQHVEPISDAKHFLDDNGLRIASYSSNNVLYINLNIFNYVSDEGYAIFKMIVQWLDGLYEEEGRPNSWNNETSAQVVNANLEAQMRRMSRESLSEMERRLRNYQESLTEYMSAVRRTSGSIRETMQRIDDYRNRDTDYKTKVAKDIETILQHDMIEDVVVNSGNITIYTNDIYAYDNLENNRYYIGKFEMVIRMDEAHIRLHNLNNPRRSYWSERDPHPHVEQNGSPCWGNVSTTVAQLCADVELYALTLTLIDYLENANVADAGGRNIVNWDMVDDEGKIIKKGGEHRLPDEYTWECESCGHGGTDDDEVYTAFNTNVGEDLHDEVTICEPCRVSEYYYSEYFDEIVHESIDDEDL